MKHVARYAVTYGLQGCYMPDSGPDPVYAATRAQLADTIRDTMAFYDIRASRFRDVGIKRLWAFIARHGASAAHFSIAHGAYVLSFAGLTEEEYNTLASGE